MSETDESLREYYHHGIVIKFDVTDNDSDRNELKRAKKDDIWLVRSLKGSYPKRQYESRMLTRIQNFAGQITDNWLKKLIAVRDFFEEAVAEIVEHRKTEIYYSTSCLKEELQDIKDTLDQTENFDPENMNSLKQTWFDTLSEWKTDMFEIEERSTKSLKAAVAEYLMKLVTTRHNPSHTFEVMLTLVLELNHIIIGNVQAVIETEHDLGFLWDTHFKNWCVDYYLRAGLETVVLDEEEETGIQEEEPEIEGLKALDTILELIVSLSDGPNVDRVQFKKSSGFTKIPHLSFLENYWECFKEKEKIVLEVLESEAKKLICIKKFLATLKPSKRSLFEKWASTAGFGEEAEQKFTQTAEMAVRYLKELKTLILKTVELWQDLTDRLEAIKYVIEFVQYKQKIQIASTFQDWEINMNIAIDELRQAHTLKVLENMWNIHIDKLFVDYKNLLMQSIQYQKATIETYAPMSRMTFELFISGLDLLMVDSSSINYKSENIPEKSITSYDSIDLEDSNFKMSEIILTCVSNAKRGYIEGMEHFRDEIQENMDKLDAIWIERKIADLDWQFSLKEEMMKQKVDRLKADVLDIRATEIKTHEDTLGLHFEAIRERLRYLTSIDISGGIQPFVEDFYITVDEVDQLDLKVSPREFPRVIAELQKANKKFDNLCLRCDHNIQREFEYIDRYFEWMQQVNIQLLRDIKLFSESGNFSSEEVSNLLFVIQRIGKDMSTEKKDIESKFKKGLEICDLEIGDKIETFVDYMKTTQNKFLQRNNLELLVNRAKRAIKREIFNGRAYLKRAQSTLSFEDEQDASILPELLEAMQNVFSFLAVPEEFNSFTGNMSGGRSRISTLRSKTSINPFLSLFKKGKGRSIRNRSKRSLVFKLDADEEDAPNNFLHKLTNIISRCKEALRGQLLSSISHSSVSRSEWSTRKASVKAKLQKGGTIILHEVESQLKEAHRKSFIVWLDMVNESLKLFNLFGNQVSKVLNEEYRRFEDKWIRRMEEIQDQLYLQLQEFDGVATKKKEKMKEGLKTMFGHPKHRERLDQKTKEAVAFCISQTNDLKKIVISRRDEVKQLLFDFIEEKHSFISDLFDKVENILDNIELEQVLQRLAHQILKSSNVKRIIRYLEPPHEQKAKLGEELESNSVDLSSSMISAPDVSTLIKSIAGKLRWIISSRDDTAVLDQKNIEVGFTLVELDEYATMCKSLKKSLRTGALKVCQLGKLALAIYLDEMQMWLRHWRTDCYHLTELFSSTPPMSKDKLSRKHIPHSQATTSGKTRPPTSTAHSRTTPSHT